MKIILKGRDLSFYKVSWEELPLHGGKLDKLLRPNKFILVFYIIFLIP